MLLRHRGQSDISDWLISTGDLEDRLQKVEDRIEKRAMQKGTGMCT